MSESEEDKPGAGWVAACVAAGLTAAAAFGVYLGAVSISAAYGEPIIMPLALIACAAALLVESILWCVHIRRKGILTGVAALMTVALVASVALGWDAIEDIPRLGNPERVTLVEHVIALSHEENHSKKARQSRRRRYPERTVRWTVHTWWLHGEDEKGTHYTFAITSEQYAACDEVWRSSILEGGAVAEVAYLPHTLAVTAVSCHAAG